MCFRTGKLAVVFTIRFVPADDRAGFDDMYSTVRALQHPGYRLRGRSGWRRTMALKRPSYEVYDEPERERDDGDTYELTHDARSRFSNFERLLRLSSGRKGEAEHTNIRPSNA